MFTLCDELGYVMNMLSVLGDTTSFNVLDAASIDVMILEHPISTAGYHQCKVHIARIVC